LSGDFACTQEQLGLINQFVSQVFVLNDRLSESSAYSCTHCLVLTADSLLCELSHVQDDRGVSRDEMAAALAAVSEGRIPKDRLALKCLYEDMSAWPYLNVEQDSQPEPSSSSSAGMSSSDYAALTDGKLGQGRKVGGAAVVPDDIAAYPMLLKPKRVCKLGSGFPLTRTLQPSAIPALSNFS
jgi:hypothetical protein